MGPYPRRCGERSFSSDVDFEKTVPLGDGVGPQRDRQVFFLAGDLGFDFRRLEECSRSHIVSRLVGGADRCRPLRMGEKCASHVRTDGVQRVDSAVHPGHEDGSTVDPGHDRTATLEEAGRYRNAMRDHAPRYLPRRKSPSGPSVTAPRAEGEPPGRIPYGFEEEVYRALSSVSRRPMSPRTGSP